MKWEVTPWGSTPTSSFEGVTKSHKWYINGELFGEFLYIKVPKHIVKLYSKGLPRGASNLTVLVGHPFPVIQLGEVNEAAVAVAGKRYKIDMQPVHYKDNGGTYTWSCEINVTALNGGYVPNSIESTECLMGSGVYIYTDDPDDPDDDRYLVGGRQCDRKESSVVLWFIAAAAAILYFSNEIANFIYFLQSL